MSESREHTSRKPQALPRHVAIIMDGNGRWARQRGLRREQGHREGVENVHRIVECARNMDLRYLTLFAFSVENWNRPKTEVNALMRLLESFLKSQAKDLIEKEIQFRVLGRTENLPRRVARLLEKTIEDTRHFSNWTLSLALNYGSRTEVLDAVRDYTRAVQQGTEDPDQLDWSTFSHYLYSEDLPDPDLVIRTSGEFRVSNFLLLQSAYAEYVFAREYWPDFGPDQFRAAIDTFCCRERRFGLTGDQIQSNHS